MGSSEDELVGAISGLSSGAVAFALDVLADRTHERRTVLAKKIASASQTQNLDATAAHREAAAAGSAPGACDKFQCGFVGDFASLALFRGGLLKLLGARPSPDPLSAMSAEHCNKVGDFASGSVFTTSNYCITTTPRDEWLHVADVENAKRLPMGQDSAGRNLGVREALSVDKLRATMLERIQASFVRVGWDKPAAALSQARPCTHRRACIHARQRIASSIDTQ